MNDNAKTREKVSYVSSAISLLLIRAPLYTKQVRLDVCILCRPFDDQQQGRVRLQTAVSDLKQSEEKPVNAIDQHRQWQKMLNRDLFYDHVFGATAQVD